MPPSAVDNILQEILNSGPGGTGLVGAASMLVKDAETSREATLVFPEPVSPGFGPAGVAISAVKTVASIADSLVADAKKRTTPTSPASAPLTIFPSITDEKPPGKAEIKDIDAKLTPKTRELFKRLIDDAPEIDVTLVTPGNLNKAMAAMGAATDINERLQAALTVSSIAEQLHAINMSNYMEQANDAVGIEQLNQQITNSMQADTMSPFNPGDGSFSQQTQDLIDRKNTLTLQVPGLANQYALADFSVTGPLAAAQAVLRQLPGIERLEQSRERKREKDALVNSITDIEAKNYASMTGQYTAVDWASPGQVFAAKKKFFVDKEFQKLTQTNVLSINDSLSARQIYSFADEPLAKRRAYAILERMEYEALGVGAKDITPEEKARRLLSLDENTRMLQIAYEDGQITEARKKVMQNAVNELGLSQKERTAKMKELMHAEKETVLQTVMQRRFISDVSQWRGFNNSDPAVGLAIEAGRKITGSSAVPLDVFTAQYLEQNPDNILYNEKLGRLRSYIISSANSASASAIMPQFSGEDIWNSVAPSSVQIWLKSILRQ